MAIKQIFASCIKLESNKLDTTGAIYKNAKEHCFAVLDNAI